MQLDERLYKLFKKEWELLYSKFNETEMIIFDVIFEMLKICRKKKQLIYELHKENILKKITTTNRAVAIWELNNLSYQKCGTFSIDDPEMDIKHCACLIEHVDWENYGSDYFQITFGEDFFPYLKKYAKENYKKQD